jgi:uncharacterized protein DUF6600
MKTTRIVLFALFLAGMTAGAGFAQLSTALGISVDPPGAPAVNLGLFYDDLAPYGTWIERPSHGYVWTPLAVADTWRPYQEGRWVWSDQGWTWISDEPFGWATYHYGRWYDDPDVGWAWVPGYDWAPSWVSWQEGPDYVGWAPLPPSVRLRSGFNGRRIALRPEAYVFVPQRHFLAPRVADFIVPAPRVLPVFRTTRNVTTYRLARGRVFSGGVPVERIGRFRPVPRFRLADFEPAPRLREARFRGPRFQGDRIAFFRPEVRRVRVAAPAFRPAARRSVMNLAEFREFRKVRGRSAPPPWAPAWGRRGLAPGQLRRSIEPPSFGRLKSSPGHLRRALPHQRAAARLHDRLDDRGIRRLRPDRVKALPRPHPRAALRQDHDRRALRLRHARPDVRPQRVLKRARPEFRARPPRSEVRMKRDRPAFRSQRIRHARPAPRMRHTRAAPSLRHVQGRSAPRMHARQGPSRQLARPARQHGRPGPRRPR